jgi:hypothetical protein
MGSFEFRFPLQFLIKRICLFLENQLLYSNTITSPSISIIAPYKEQVQVCMLQAGVSQPGEEKWECMLQAGVSQPGEEKWECMLQAGVSQPGEEKWAKHIVCGD